MKRSVLTSYPFFAFCLSAGLLIGAWVFQYGFGYFPCTVCYWQRHAHKSVIALAILAMVWRYFNPQNTQSGLFHALLILGFLASAGLALYHVGVEYLWWEGPKTCGSGALTVSKPIDLLAELDKKIKPPACKDVVWSLFGLSMAGYNFLASLLGASLGFIANRNKGLSA